MDLQIKGKRALVLGSSQGLGKAVAKALADEGANVVLASRNAERLKEAVLQISAHSFYKFDLGQPDAGKILVEQVIKDLGGIDVLVTNAGGPSPGKFIEIDNEKWLSAYQTLFLGVVDTIKAALPGMLERKWGRILMITSLAGKEPTPNMIISNSLRAGIHGLMKGVSKEVASGGVTINALLPSYTDTARLKELKLSSADLIQKIPAQRLGKPDEFGALAAFLCSEQASFITGQAIAYDGGSSQGI